MWANKRKGDTQKKAHFSNIHCVLTNRSALPCQLALSTKLPIPPGCFCCYSWLCLACEFVFIVAVMLRFTKKSETFDFLRGAVSRSVRNKAGKFSTQLTQKDILLNHIVVNENLQAESDLALVPVLVGIGNGNGGRPGCGWRGWLKYRRMSKECEGVASNVRYTFVMNRLIPKVTYWWYWRCWSRRRRWSWSWDGL
jgi:hypothetical protein